MPGSTLRWRKHYRHFGHLEPHLSTRREKGEGLPPSPRERSEPPLPLFTCPQHMNGHSPWLPCRNLPHRHRRDSASDHRRSPAAIRKTSTSGSSNLKVCSML